MKSPPPWLEPARERVLAELGSEDVVIVDVGAAGAPSPAAATLANFASYLGFDPDLRSPQLSSAFGFRTHTVMNKAVTPSADGDVVFNLTKYPECSSVLSPDAAEISNYTIDDFFTIVGQARVPAVTLSVALAEAGLMRLDWLKLDTQGTDLALLCSLPERLASKLMLVDVEPGVSPFYVGEDRLSAIHEHMLASGFWLTDLGAQRFPRLSVAARAQLKLDPFTLRLLAPSPFAVQLQYARTVHHLAEHGAQPRDYVAGWLLAMAHGHTAYALDLAAALVRRGSTDAGTALVNATLHHVRSTAGAARPRTWERWWNLLVPPAFPKAWRRIWRAKS